MSKEITDVRTFGDVRQLIIQSIMQIRDGGLEPNQANAMVGMIKGLHDNIQCEINAVKVTLQAEAAGHNFGRVVKMGQKLISGEADDTPALTE